MPNVACIYCGTQNALPQRYTVDTLITIRCRNCHRQTPTGHEDGVRTTWEECIARNYPPLAAARAVALSNAIYKTAESGQNSIEMSKTQRAIEKHFKGTGFDSPGMVGGWLIKGRTHKGYTDSTAVCAVIVFDNGSANPKYSIYVVFRGSRGAIMASNDPSVNVDWRANFDNAMVQTDYAGPGIQVHGGFTDSLGSYRMRVLHAVGVAFNAYPNAHLVVTGHSQGAGHATLFAHWLLYRQPVPRPFLIPFSPPRVGNFAFAHDLTTRLSNRGMTLPYDGNAQHGCYMMVKGEDPVVFEMKHSFRGKTIQETWAAADSQSILKQAKYAQAAEKHRSNYSEVYFHPKFLTQISSWTPKIGLLKGVDHDPGLFEDRIIDFL